MEEDDSKSQSLQEDIQISPKLFVEETAEVNDDAQKDKETIRPEVLIQKNFSLDEDGNTKLKREIEDKELDIETLTADLGNGNEKAKVIELLKKVAELNRVISESNLKNTKMGEELEAYKEKVTVSGKVIRGLKEQRSNQEVKENQMEQELQSIKRLLDYVTKVAHSYEERILGLSAQVSDYEAEISEHDDQITELNKKNKHYTSEISQLKSMHKTKENNWRASIGKLRKEVEEKGESVDDLTKMLDNVQAEKCSQDNLIQELETRLNSLQSDHEGVLASSENAQRVTNELTERVRELEREVDMQKEVISVRDEEKREAIRQLSSSLDTVQAEKCSQDNLIQEMETRLNSLQADHEGVLASSENAQNVTNELTQRVLELEKEVDMQREVISVRDEEKREAIRQLSSSLDHYKSKYQELYQAFVTKNAASCFDFLH